MRVAELIPLDMRLGDFREVFAATVVKKFAGSAGSVLVVGPSWGRDVITLTRTGKTVVSLDIAPQPHLPLLVLGNAEQAFPFADASFEAVVMTEILEHLFDDVHALEEARRVLRHSGRLIVSVPFYNDTPEYHVRLHSPRMIYRLLQRAGFKITEVIYRGGSSGYVRTWHGLRRLARVLGMAPSIERLFVALHLWIGRRAPGIWRFTPYYGIFILARKGAAKDFSHLNVEQFATPAALALERHEVTN